MMAESEKKTRTPLWMRGLLLGSLALNLAVAGIVAGRHGPERFEPPRGRDFVTPYTRAFTPEQRRELGAQLRARFERGRDERPPPFADYRQALDLLRREPFDRAGFEAALAAQDGRAAARQQMGQQVLAEYMAGLPPAARAAYADRLQEDLDRLIRRIEKARK